MININRGKKSNDLDRQKKVTSKYQRKISLRLIGKNNNIQNLRDFIVELFSRIRILS